jgi:hypothetical protein
VEKADFEHADVRIITDRRATTQAILERLAWLVNGTLPGDRRCLRAHVVGFSDSCHSGDLSTRSLERVPRVMPAPIDIAWRHETARRAKREPLSFVHAIKGENVALISGCRSDQTSDDAVFGGRPNGALGRAGEPVPNWLVGTDPEPDERGAPGCPRRGRAEVCQRDGFARDMRREGAEDRVHRP